MASVPGPPTSICCSASAMPTPGPPVISLCRRRRACCSRSRRARPRKRWGRSPSHGGHGAARPPACSGPTIAQPSSATARRSRRRWAMAELDGPRLEPRSGPARQLVVFLHGYGADGNDLIDIGRAWQGLLPQAAFVSPHAPEPCAQAPTGRQWFPLTFRDPNERWTGVNKAAPMLQRFLDAELARHKLPPSALALVGFSQGTMMALHVGLRRASPLAAIVGYSGLLVLPPDLNAEKFAAEIKSRPPILLVHGDRDDLIPAQALFQAAQGLAALDIPVEWHLSAGIGPGIDGDALRQGGEFLARRFAAKR